MSEQNANERELLPEEEQAAAEATVLPSPEKKNKKLNWKKEAVDYMEIMVFAITFVMLLFSFLFRICTVKGGSMENTLYEGESLVVSDLFYEPKTGDIIVFHQTGVFSLNEPVVKRVIATEGESVSIQYASDTMKVSVKHTDGSVTVLEEPYMKYEQPLIYTRPATYTVPEGHLFVLGDNRNNSADSRSGVIGMVDERRVLGKVLFRVTPLSRLGAVE